MKTASALVFIENIKTLEQFEATIMLQLDRLNRLLGGQMPLLDSGVPS